MKKYLYFLTLSCCINPPSSQIKKQKRAVKAYIKNKISKDNQNKISRDKHTIEISLVAFMAIASGCGVCLILQQRGKKRASKSNSSQPDGTVRQQSPVAPSTLHSPQSTHPAQQPASFCPNSPTLPVDVLLHIFDMLHSKEIVQLGSTARAHEFAMGFGSALSAVSKNGLNLEKHQDYNRYARIVRAAVEQNPMALQFAGQFTNKKEIVLAAVGQNGAALRFVSDGMRKDIDVIVAAISENIWAALFIDVELRKNKTVHMCIQQACKIHARWLAPAEFQQARQELFLINDRVEENCEYWLTVLRYLPSQSSDIPQAILDQNKEAFKNEILSLAKKGVCVIPSEMKLDKYIALELVKANPSMFCKFHSADNSPLMVEEEILLEVIRSTKEWIWFKDNYWPYGIYTRLREPDMINAIVASLQTRVILNKYDVWNIGPSPQSIVYHYLINQISKLPKEDKLKILQLNPYCIKFMRETPDQPIDEDLIREALPNYPAAAEYFSLERRSDLGFMKGVIQINPLAIRYICINGAEDSDNNPFCQYAIHGNTIINSGELLNIAEIAVRKNGLALQYMYTSVQKDEKFKSIVRIAIEQNPLAIQYSGKFTDKTFAMYVAKNGSCAALKKLYKLLDYKDYAHLDKDFQIRLAGVKNNPLSAVNSTDLWSSIAKDKKQNAHVIREICMLAMQAGGGWRSIPEWLRKDKDFQEAAIKNNLENIQCMIYKKIYSFDQVKQILKIN